MPNVPRDVPAPAAGTARWSTSTFDDGEESEAWSRRVTTLEDLVWSVQPKRSAEDRKHLVALLPSLLKRLCGGHALADLGAGRARGVHVEPRRGARRGGQAVARRTCASPTAAVAEAGARLEAEIAKAAGDEARRRRPKRSPRRWRRPRPSRSSPSARSSTTSTSRSRAASSAAMWVEFEGEDGQLAFAKLAWVSPLRGTYLFTNRQGQKALSMTAEELAERFRADRARLVEAEPLIDRAFTQHAHADRGQVRREGGLKGRRPVPRRPRREDPPCAARAPIGALIIGDEILSGKRQDKHLPHVIETLARARARARLRALPRRRSRAAHRRAARFVRARRPRVQLRRHRRDARRSHAAGGRRGARRSARSAIPRPCAELEAQFGAEAYPNRVLMAEFPPGSRIIPNPFNRVAAFADPRPPLLPRLPADGVADARLGARHVVPRSRARASRSSARIVVHDAGESQLLPLMDENVAQFPARQALQPAVVPAGRRRAASSSACAASRATSRGVRGAACRRRGIRLPLGAAIAADLAGRPGGRAAARAVLRAVGRALPLMFHGRLLGPLALWTAGAFTLWTLIGIVAFEPLTRLIADSLGTRNAGVYAGVAIFVLLLLVLLAVVTVLVGVALLAMPAIVRVVSARHFPDLERRRGGTFAGSLVNLAVAFALFLPAWLVALLLFPIPPLYVLISWRSELRVLWTTLRARRGVDRLPERASELGTRRGKAAHERTRGGRKADSLAPRLCTQRCFALVQARVRAS